MAAILRDKAIESMSLSWLKTNPDNPISRVLNLATTFVLVCLAWVFFRADNIADAVQIISNMANVHKSQLGLYCFGAELKNELMLSFLFLVILVVVEFLTRKGQVEQKVGSLSTPIRWSLYLLFGVIIALFSVFGNQEFIYFQF